MRGWATFNYGVKTLKEDYSLRSATKQQCAEVLEKHHYLSVKKLSKGFKCGINYALHHNVDGVVGVIIFTGFPVPELVRGLFGLERTDQTGFFELSRLCLLPSHQQNEDCITSWFVAKALKQLKRDTFVRAILSYADAEHHNGTIYAACNFQYFGLTDKKCDFFKRENGEFRKVSRGAIKGLGGEWRPRSQKHRFLILNDRKLKPLWGRQQWKTTVSPNK